MPHDLESNVARVREGNDRNIDPHERALLTEWAVWRQDVLEHEQQEAGKIETLCGLWRVFERHAEAECAELVERYLRDHWSIHFIGPPDFLQARRAAARHTRMIHELPREWRFL